MFCVEPKYELDFDDPGEEILNYAKENLNEHPDTKLIVLRNFANKILEHGGEISNRLDDAFLLKFLRAQNFDVQKAFELLLNYYKFKQNHPEYYNDVLFERMIAIANDNIMSTVPFTEGSGRRILIFKMGIWVPERISVMELFQATLLAVEMGILEQKSQILGGIAIVDVGGVKFKHLTYMTPKVASQMAEIALHAYPIKVHAVHFVNQNIFFKVGYKVLQPFLPKEAKDRIFMHGNNFKTLHQHISPNYLPEIYGGVHPDYSYAPWLRYVENNAIVLDELKRLGYTLEEQARKKLTEDGTLAETFFNSSKHTNYMDNSIVNATHINV